VFSIYSLYFTSLFSTNTFEEPKIRVLIPAPDFGGEGDMAVRLEKAARNIGWEAQAFFFSNQWSLNHPFDFHRRCEPFEYQKDNPSFLSKIICRFKPDFFICLNPKFYAPMKYKIPYYLALTRSHAINIEKHGNKIKKFQGFLAVDQDHQPLIDFLSIVNRECKLVEWYPITIRTKFQNSSVTKLFYCGVNWDSLRSSDCYKRCLQMLDQTGLMDIWGPKYGLDLWGLQSYRGSLPYDGVSLINAIKKCGAALLLHSQEHLQHDVISGRIFEAAAAGAVIISDRHKFIEKEFGDTVLYIDIDKNNKLSAEEMFKQINNHLTWILDNPDQALEMAQKAHAIFDAKFTLEAQLKRLGDFHNQHKMFYDF
jgi:glycosyltransferase involved in cell wall biosynthesis